MLDLFLISSKRFVIMAIAALTRSPDGSATLGVRRVLVMLGFLPVFALAQGIHWLGFLLDEILYRGYRRVEVRAPLFVLGVPRSGTTKLHEVLARDDHYTTFSAWECLFALSVTERRFWRACGRIDALVGRPAARALAWIERRVFSSLDDVHAMSLRTPEEDYFALMPILSCFILFLPFPAAEHVWRMGRFDSEMPERDRRRILEFYHACLQKHLYVHGPHKRLLSKNAAFAPLALSLAHRFPDARFIVCVRDPAQTVPSQLSSIESGLDFFGVPTDSASIRERLVDQLAFYYQNLDALARMQPRERCAVITLPQIKAGLSDTMTGAYRQLGLPLSPTFARLLEAETDAARRYHSSHGYTLSQFGLDPARIDLQFGVAYRHLTLHARSVVGGETPTGASERSQGPHPGVQRQPEGAVSC